MKVSVRAIKHTPNGIETIELENVASFRVDDNGIEVKFNGEPDTYLNLTNTETEKNGCWFGLSIFCEKIGLKVNL